jgi:hypothetical protein
MFDSTVISFFKSAKHNTPDAEVTLRQFLTSVKHADIITKLRLIEDKAERDQRKKDLPAATISGTFTVRRVADVKHYNGVVCLDFDAKENPNLNPERMKLILSDIEEVAYAGLSVSGQGVFAIIFTDNTNPDDHPRMVDFIGSLMVNIGLVYDRACKDISRLRFVSYDRSAIIRDEPKIFPARTFLDRSAETRPRPITIRQYNDKDPASTETKVIRLIEKIEATRTDLTTDYEQWLRIGIAFATEFGDRGEEYFLRVSQFHPNFSQPDAEKKFSELCKNGKRIKINTFFHICKQNRINL